jgi:uncharacterized protein
MTGDYSYDYSTRQGVLPISWEDFHGLCKALAVAIAPFAPEVVLPVGRGGYYPGALLAHMLQVEVYPVRLSRRVNDVARYEAPQWLQEPPGLVEGRRVLVVDEISSSGDTLRMVRERALELGASEVRGAVLYAHTWGTDEPDYIALISDALLMNPWDREILCGGGFEFHPEYAGALAEQGLAPDPSLLIPATNFRVAKQPSA